VTCHGDRIFRLFLGFLCRILAPFCFPCMLSVTHFVLVLKLCPHLFRLPPSFSCYSAFYIVLLPSPPPGSIIVVGSCFFLFFFPVLPLRGRSPFPEGPLGLPYTSRPLANILLILDNSQLTCRPLGPLAESRALSSLWYTSPRLTPPE